MARTAPVPNIPPIPGMCPSIAVMGGGAGGGGGSGNGPGDGNGDASGDGSGSGDGAAGDGTGAGDCGQGSGGSCPNPQHGNPGSVAAGDPIDPVSGEVYTVPSVDLVLGGTFPLRLERRYASARRKRDVGLGPGWCHSFAWDIEELRGRVRLHTGDGGQFTCKAIEPGSESVLREGTLHRTTDGYRLVSRGGISREFQRVGQSGARYALASVSDGYGNGIRLEYDTRGQLARLVDSVGRSIRVDRDANDKISAFSVFVEPENRWHSFFSYEYDSGLNLSGATDARGMRWSYLYDHDHRLTRETYPSGRAAHFAYDTSGRCCETWVSRPEVSQLGLDENVALLLADGSPAKGVLHVRVARTEGYLEVTNSRDVKRYFVDDRGIVDKTVFGGGVHSSQFDAWGLLTEYRDAKEQTWTWQRDLRGRLLAEVNPQGAKRTYQYAANGQLSSLTDPSGRTVRYDRNLQGDLLLAYDDDGPLIQYDYGPTGLATRIVLPDGSVTHMQYDARGNRVRVQEPDGSVRQIQYDFFGRPTGFVDERGAVTKYTYDDNGRLIRVLFANGSRRDQAYDRDGNLSSVTNELGQQHVLTWGGYNQVLEVRRPDASTVQLRYDREGDLTEVTNQRGERHRIERSPAGRVLAEHTFDGRTIRFKNDNQGELEQLKSALGSTVFERDDAGRIVKRTFRDGSEHSFEYDILGRLVSATTQDVRCSFTYDRRGRVICEEQSAAGETHEVRREVNGRGLCTRLETDRGHALELRYDERGLPEAITLDRADTVRFEHDPGGAELRRMLPSGGQVVTERDTMGWLSKRHVVSPSSSSPTVLQSFQHRDDGYLVLERDAVHGATEYEYDSVGALVARRPEKTPEEAFLQDGAGAADDGAGCRWAPGGRMVSHDGFELRYDADHRLVERTRMRDGKLERWSYEWAGPDLLSRVTGPDSSVTDYRYDCFARRIAKIVTPAEGRRRTTRYVWSGDDIVHEIVQESGRAEPVEERTYVVKPGTMDLLAEGHSAEGRRSWQFPLSDRRSAPDRMLDGAGRVVEDLQLKAFGALEAGCRAATRLRFAGHWYDEESGLHYNRHRYLEPESGRYISPEPLGLQGGLGAFTYADQSPYEIVDPNGLLGMNATASGPAGSFTRGSASTEGVASSSVDLHPVVVGALATQGHHNIPFSTDPRSPRACAEPRAVSDYLRAYEEQNGVVLDPNTPEGREHTRRALAGMSVGANQADNNRRRAPCRNCSQFFGNLMQQYGEPNPENITPGFRGAQGDNPANMTNFTPPRATVGGHAAYPARP